MTATTSVFIGMDSSEMPGLAYTQPCFDASPGKDRWLCSLPEGHDGIHVTHGWDRFPVLAIWDDEGHEVAVEHPEPNTDDSILNYGAHL